MEWKFCTNVQWLYNFLGADKYKLIIKVKKTSIPFSFFLFSTLVGNGYNINYFKGPCLEDYACGPNAFCMEDYHHKKTCMCKPDHFVSDPDQPELAETEGCKSQFI